MLNKKTLNFLNLVAENNNREWFAENKHLYEEAKADVVALAVALIKGVSTIDPLISSDADPKKSVLRIYRDVRFSKNKDPYKNNFGVWFSAKAKGGNEPGYYLHIQPGQSFIAGGYWMPEVAHLKLIRQEIDYNINDFLAIIEDKVFAENFKLSMNNSLKNAPRGYDLNDPNIKFLKLKSFEVLQKIDDIEFFDPKVVDKLISTYKIIYPLVVFLRKAITG